MKTLIIHLRKSIKLIIVIIVALLLALGIMYFLFRPMYAVKLNGKIIGYTDAKKQLEEKIQKYMKSGDGGKIAFVEIDELPEYEICYSKNDVKVDEDEVFDTVISTGTPYYKDYAVLVDGEEKYYVATYEEAEKIIADLKEKESTNVDSITYVAKYSSEELSESKVEDVVAALFVEPEPEPEPVTVVQKTTTTTRNYSSSSGGYSSGISYSYQSIGVSLIRPVPGTITSRFGRRSSGTHKGLDIATSTGTPIGAAAGGTVTYAGWNSTGYGNFVLIDHGNGVQTGYAHCSAVYVSVGQYVSQGQTIAAVGSTGNSTGPHLHLEVRINGVCQNPQNYLY